MYYRVIRHHFHNLDRPAAVGGEYLVVAELRGASTTYVPSLRAAVSGSNRELPAASNEA